MTSELTDDRLEEIEIFFKGARFMPADLHDVNLYRDEIVSVFAMARRCKAAETQLAETEDSLVKAIGLHQTVVAERDALKDEVAHLRGLEQNTYDTWKETHKREITTLRANNAVLRAELQTAVNIFGDMTAYGKIGPIDDPSAYYVGEDTLKLMHEALASTPADSLTEYRNGVLEETEVDDYAAVKEHNRVLKTEQAILKAQVARLRGAANALLYDKGNEDLWQPLANAVRETPAQSLAVVRNGVLEEVWANIKPHLDANDPEMSDLCWTVINAMRTDQ